MSADSFIAIKTVSRRAVFSVPRQSAAVADAGLSVRKLPRFSQVGHRLGTCHAGGGGGGGGDDRVAAACRDCGPGRGPRFRPKTLPELSF